MEAPDQVVRRRRPPLWRRFLPLLGLVVLGWVLSRLDLPAMGQALSQVSVATVVLSSLSFCANLLVKAHRWQRLLRVQGIFIPPRVAVAAFLSGQFYGQVTLGRLGEFFRMEALIERDVSAGAALASCVFDRLLDVFVVLLAAVVFGALVLGNARTALIAALLMAALALGLWFLLVHLGAPSSEGSQNRAQRIVSKIAERPGLSRFAKISRELVAGMRPMLRPAALAEASLFSLLAWAGYFIALFQLVSGLGLVVSRVLLTATASFAALSALLPVTISGLGARELIYINVLQSHGVTKEAAVVVSLLHLFVMSVSATVLGFGGVLLRQRQRL